MESIKKIRNKILGCICFLSIQFLGTAQVSKNIPANFYTNPILHADYSDPDAIRVGDYYYMIASSFNHVPGLPILASTNLVDWQLIGHALNTQTPTAHFEKVQHGGGVWAPSIRFHNNEFYIYYPDPDFGIYLTKSKNISGPWSTPELVAEGKGLIDPCPLWDDNGKVYLVHAFAGSRAGIKSLLAIKELNARGTKAIRKSELVYDGHGIDPTIEGPKFYKRGDWYYIFAPAGGVSTGWQTVLRSKKVYGPYERKVVMDQGSSKTNGPHQGAWVSTPLGEDWFIHFQDKDAYGRIVHLQPMHWNANWPVIGLDTDGDGKGEPVAMFKRPNILNRQPALPTLDTSLEWQWQANPQSNWTYHLGKEKRFYAIPKTDTTLNYWTTPSLYLQKIPAENFTTIAEITFNAEQVGERAGFMVFGMDYAAIVLEKTISGLQVKYLECKQADKNKPEQVQTISNYTSKHIFLKLAVNEGAICTFSFSADGVNYSAPTKQFVAKPGKWVGAKMGIFCAAEKSTNDAGYLIVNSFTTKK